VAVGALILFYSLLGYFYGILPQELRETTKYFSPDRQDSDR